MSHRKKVHLEPETAIGIHAPVDVGVIPLACLESVFEEARQGHARQQTAAKLINEYHEHRSDEYRCVCDVTLKNDLQGFIVSIPKDLDSKVGLVCVGVCEYCMSQYSNEQLREAFGRAMQRWHIAIFGPNLTNEPKR